MVCYTATTKNRHSGLDGNLDQPTLFLRGSDLEAAGNQICQRAEIFEFAGRGEPSDQVRVRETNLLSQHSAPRRLEEKGPDIAILLPFAADPKQCAKEWKAQHL